MAAISPMPSQTAVLEADTSVDAATMSRVCGAKTGGCETDLIADDQIKMNVYSMKRNCSGSPLKKNVPSRMVSSIVKQKLSEIDSEKWMLQRFKWMGLPTMIGSFGNRWYCDI